MRRWLCLAVIAPTACGRVSFDDLTPLGDGGADASDEERPLCTTPFSAPVVILELASPYAEFCPELTDDGLEIFWHGNEPAGMGGDDVWTAVRASTTEAFGPRALVANVNSTTNDGGPSLSRDGLELYFSSERNGGSQGEIFVARRSSRDVAFGAAQRIVELGSSGYETGPMLSADGLTLYFGSNRSGGRGGTDLWFATRSSITAPFEAPRNLTALNTPGSQASPAISANGLSLVFDSAEAGLEADLWVATRASRADEFLGASKVDELNLGNSTDIEPSISASGERITFGSDRRGTQDPFVATRVCP